MTATERTTSLPPSLPPTKDDLRAARGDPIEDTWIMGDHPTRNPDGVTNSNVDYWPKTQEEKAERPLVEMVDVLEIPWDQPYPEGDPPDADDRIDLLMDVHTPQELVEAANFDEQHTRNLAAGGSVPPKEVMVADEFRDNDEEDETPDADTRSQAKNRTRGRKGKARRSR